LPRGLHDGYDHFYPGCADIAWDIAAAVVEFDLDADDRRYLVGRYQAESGDRISPGLLDFYGTVYLCLRP